MCVDWEPKTFEDSLLYAYWKKVGGKLYLEVPIGGSSASEIWKIGSKIRRIDGVWVPSSIQESGIFTFRKNRKQFEVDISHSSPIHIIEVKKKLNRLVIGQALVGKVMFERQYQKTVQPLVLCHVQDSAMKWSCEQLGVEVELMQKESE